MHNENTTLSLKSAFSNRGFLISLAVFVAGTILAAFASSAPGRLVGEAKQRDSRGCHAIAHRERVKLPGRWSKFLGANERTAGRGWHRAGHKLQWPYLRGHARRRHFSLHR